MLSDSLVTNEIKNAAGTEIEFSRRSQGVNETEYYALSEGATTEHTMRIKHAVSGTGRNKVQSSAIRFDKTVISTVDLITPCIHSFYFVLKSPIGLMLAKDESKNVIAEGMSFLASLGANTTILYDCSGNGALSLINRSL
jgi:hypothetical protein